MRILVNPAQGPPKMRPPILGWLAIVCLLSSGCSTVLKHDDIDARLASIAARALSRDFRIDFHLERDPFILKHIRH